MHCILWTGHAPDKFATGSRHAILPRLQLLIDWVYTKQNISLCSCIGNCGHDNDRVLISCRCCVDACEGFECNFQGELCEVDDSGQPSCVCADVCIALYAPVCASDGKTYSNKCWMNVKACQNRVPLNVTYSGKCNTTAGAFTSLYCNPLMWTCTQFSKVLYMTDHLLEEINLKTIFSFMH